MANKPYTNLFKCASLKSRRKDLGVTLGLEIRRAQGRLRV